MGFLNQSIAQIRDLFASMTPAARITAALLLGVIGVSLAYLFHGYAGGADDYLFGGEFLQAREADRVEAAIAKAGLAGYEREGGRIKVPRGQKSAYMAAVADAGALPANFDKVLDESLDLGPWVDRDTRAQRVKAARERQLSMILRHMHGIEDASVLFDVREARGFGKDKMSATVSVQPAAGEALDPHHMNMIRGAVAGAVAGLDPKDVTILNLGDGSQYDGGAGSAPDFDTPYFQTKTAYERLMKGNIEDLLRDIPGLRVQVMAELDDSLGAELRTTKTEGDATPVRETNQTQSTNSTQVDDRGRPGLTAQGPNRAAPESAVAKNENKSENSGTETENFVPFSEEQLKKSGLVPKHVRAAVAVPSAYLEKVWRETNPTAAADAAADPTQISNIERDLKDKIKNTVTPLFPKELGENPYPNVEVTVFQSLKPAPVIHPSFASEGMQWASQNSGALIMAGLALVSLVMLRSMVKSIPPPETNIVLAPSLAPGTERDETSPSRGAPRSGPAGGERKEGAAGSTAAPGAVAAKSERSRPKLNFKKGASLKDELSDIVRDNPDAAAAILRTWIGNAS